MKTLRNHVLLYDQDCPLCKIYTGAFIKRGWLDEAGKHPYQQTPESWQQSVDMDRARNEIALLDKETGEVQYGIDALIKVIANRHPRMGTIANTKAARFVALRLYRFVSYNRKVIAAVKPKDGAHECKPAFSARYRWLYLIVAWLFTSVVLTKYASLLAGLIPPSSFGREFLICGGQIAFQSCVLYFLQRTKTMDYLGNMMTVSLIGALLLLPAIGISFLIKIPAIIAAGWFGLVVAFMLYEHSRRCKLLGLGWTPSATWVLYRLLVLGFMLLS